MKCPSCHSEKVKQVIVGRLTKPGKAFKCLDCYRIFKKERALNSSDVTFARLT
jgi:transposase-like protein